MSTVTLGSRGRITLPTVVRQGLQVDAGDRIDFVGIGPGRYAIVAAPRSSVRELKGMFGKAKRCVSIDEMNAVIARLRSRPY